MAKYEVAVIGDFDTIVTELDNALVKGSASLSLEEVSDYYLGETRVAIRAYERYSIIGKNRSTLQLSIVTDGQEIVVTAIATGASQGVFFKLNHFSDENFLNTVIPAIERFKK